MATDTESVLAFVNSRYTDLKNEAEADNDPANENITHVITLIDNLYKTITTKDDISHEKIVEQLKALKTRYNELGLTGSYTRYIEANNSLNMIVGGLEEVEAEAESPASAPASKASGSTALALVSKASTALVPASRALVSTASGSPASTASGLKASGSTALVKQNK